jgi:hypothetical protein
MKENPPSSGPLYDRFVVNYAAAEDRIRHIHEELEHECRRILVRILSLPVAVFPGYMRSNILTSNQTFMDQKFKEILERDKQCEKSHIEALAATRKACEGVSRCTPSILPFILRRYFVL